MDAQINIAKFNKSAILIRLCRLPWNVHGKAASSASYASAETYPVWPYNRNDAIVAEFAAIDPVFY